MKQLIWLLKALPFVILIFLGLLWYLSVHVAPYMIISPPRIQGTIYPADLGLDAAELKISTEDSLILRGYHIKSSMPSKGTMILIHGIGGCKEHFLLLAKELSEFGWESVVFDQRAHGESDGRFCTYGYFEKSDVMQIVDYLLAENPNQKIGLWGNSLGGAVALQVMAADERIAFGLIESTFTELDVIVSDYQKRFAGGVGSKWLTDYVLKNAGKIAGFNPDDVKPVVSAAKITNPVLIAHGDSDDNISVVYGSLLYEALGSAEKELIIVEGGEHYGLFETGGDSYKNQLFDFIRRNENLISDKKRIRDEVAPPLRRLH